MVVLVVRRAWPLLLPHTDLVAGLYFALLLMGGVGSMGAVQAGLARWALAWWERRKGAPPLTTEGETLLILLAFTLVQMMTLVLLVLFAGMFPV